MIMTLATSVFLDLFLDLAGTGPRSASASRPPSYTGDRDE
jgi:hypothetical protein